MEVYLVVTGLYLVTGYAILIGLRALERRYAIGR
jgi:polar amino acid transport system permease protein